MSGARVNERVREGKLASASELFELGALVDAPTDASFVRRLNSVVARQREDMQKKIPATLADAIKSDGALKKHADLVVLGEWLLVDGHPGMKPSPGIRANRRTVLECVAVVMAEFHFRSIKKSHGSASSGRKSRKREITKREMAHRWKMLFGEILAPSVFGSRLRSVQRILPHYLKHLESGSALHGGKKIKKSPEIERALDAITGMLPASRNDRPEILTEPDVTHPARLVPFEIALGYQSDAHEEEYRQLPKGIRPVSRLRYVPKTTTATASSGTVHSNRAGKVILQPDVGIRRDYKVTALIDRLVILLQVNKPANERVLAMLIKRETKAKCFVKDILHKQDLGDAWGAPLSDFDPKNLSGYPLAIMIQEPMPVLLADIVKTIDAAHGIVGQILFHLIEVSVDFYPKKPVTPEEAVLRRERMVGLLQRHHWTRPSRILEPASAIPRYADARQLSEKEIAYGEVVPKTDFLFAHNKSSGGLYRNESDALVSDPEIRKRILTKKPGSKLWLNSTIAKGGKFSPHMVSIQHKIADRRNLGKKTFISLPNEERRARMEVTISGTDTLKKHGLHTIDDLSSISFRKLTRDFLRCRVPIIEPLQQTFEDAQVQMRNRGVYGINLRLRALAEERRLAAKQAGKKLPRKTKDEELGLADWKEMNDVVGDALDGLKRRWSSFTTR